MSAEAQHRDDDCPNCGGDCTRTRERLAREAVEAVTGNMQPTGQERRPAGLGQEAMDIGRLLFQAVMENAQRRPDDAKRVILHLQTASKNSKISPEESLEILDTVIRIMSNPETTIKWEDLKEVLAGVVAARDLTFRIFAASDVATLRDILKEMPSLDKAEVGMKAVFYARRIAQNVARHRSLILVRLLK